MQACCTCSSSDRSAPISRAGACRAAVVTRTATASHPTILTSTASSSKGVPDAPRKAEAAELLGSHLAAAACLASASSRATRALSSAMQAICMDHRRGRANNSGLCLVHVKGLELHIWLRSDDGGGNWELVDTVSQPEVFGDHFAKPFWDSVAAHQLNLMDEDDDGHLDLYSDECSVGIHAVGDGAELVFLTVGKGVFYLDIKRRTAEKVLQRSVRQGYLCQIFPFMMPWPPVFPAPNEGHDKDE